jgi:hypothetical protein
MKNELLTLEEASERIASGAVMSIAGEAALLAKLPQGRWIGGSTVYFMTADGGKVERARLFCSTFPEGTQATARFVPTDALSTIPQGYLSGGVSLVIIPAFSAAHARFAQDGAEYPHLFDQPLLGWISGVHLEEIGQVMPVVFDGATGQRHEDGAVVLHITTGAQQAPRLDIINIFQQGGDEDLVFTFPEVGFSAKTALLHGKEINLAAYLTEKSVDTRLPLVANYAGAMINVSFQKVDPASGLVDFYAPVFPGVEYRLAAPQGDYVESFGAQAGTGGANMLSCNCILNYLYGELEGKSTSGFTGPVTFGEIAYILLNQTLVKLELAA